MIRQSRCLLLLMVLTTVGLAWPSDVAAQRRPPSAARAGVAVPRTYAPGIYRPVTTTGLHPGTTPGTPTSLLLPVLSRVQFWIWYRIRLVWVVLGRVGVSVRLPRGISLSARVCVPLSWDDAYDNTGSARLLITPRNAQVYVDGQFLGLVGEFDGSRQVPTVPTGAHEVQVYLEGYRSLTQKVLFTRGTTLRIESALQPLTPGEPPEPKPAPKAATLRTDPYQSHTQAPPHLVRVNAPNPGPCHSASTLPTRSSSSTAGTLIARRERAGLRLICPKVRIRSKFGSRATAGTREASTFSAVKRCR